MPPVSPIHLLDHSKKSPTNRSILLFISLIMKLFATLSLFAVSAMAADWGKSCEDEVLDNTTGILTARCNNGDGQGTFVDAELYLYGCLKYTNGKISVYSLSLPPHCLYSQCPQAPGSDGTFGDVCKDCSVYRLDDALYGFLGVTRPWISCTCDGSSEPVTLNLGTSL